MPNGELRKFSCQYDPEGGENHMMDFIHLRDSGLCDSTITRLERIKYVFLLLNIVRQCDLRRGGKFDPVGNPEHFLPHRVPKWTGQVALWLRVRIF